MRKTIPALAKDLVRVESGSSKEPWRSMTCDGRVDESLLGSRETRINKDGSMPLSRRRFVRSVPNAPLAPVMRIRPGIEFWRCCSDGNLHQGSRAPWQLFIWW